ncbi:ABC-2 family transporter protein [Actinomycetes bacterium KLBMP 9759]
MAERVYQRIVASRLRGRLAYPTSFVLDVLGQAIGQMIELVVILVLFTTVGSLGGFRPDEVMLIYGMASIAFGLAHITAGQVEQLPEYIRTGEFDVMLLRPLNTLAQVLTADVELRRLGRLLVGLCVMAWAVGHVDVEWTPLHVLIAVLAPIFGALILGSIWVATNAISFWLVDAREFANAFTYGSNFSTAYPITMYGAWLRGFMCFAVPSAFVAYFPTLALLDRPDPLGLPEALRYASPLAAAASVLVAGFIWRSGIRHYQGTGS